MKETRIKERNYRLQFMNIKLRPSGTEAQYSQLLKRAFNLKRPIRVRGEDCLVLKSQKETECSITPERKTIVLTGKIVKYTRIDGKDWFDLNTMDKAENVAIPNNVFPNLKETDYFWFPEAHRLVFIKGSGFSPNTVKVFFDSLLKQALPGEDSFEVNIITDSVKVEKILNASEIRKLVVSLSYSNADEHDSAAEVLDHLIRDSNADNLRNEMTGKIDPQSKLVKALLDLSSNNGFAEARVKEPGDTRFKVIKTTDYPQTVDIKSDDTSLIHKIALFVINMWRRS